MSDNEEGERSPSPERVTPYPAALPVSPLKIKGYEQSQSESQHFTVFLYLAAELRDEIIKTAEPAFRNFLRYVRDHDIGLLSTATIFVGRGASFSVRRTLIPEHRNVVFKSSLQTLYRPDKSDEARRLDAVLLELRVLTHPPIRTQENIVDLLQIGWEGDLIDISRKWPVLVMEYADLGSLVDYFDREPELPWSVLKMLCEDVARGLLALHHCGIVHGDLKLANVLVFSTDEEGRPSRAKLSDFGGALLDSDTLESMPMPTPPWNAPESAVDRPRVRLISSDVYSLGLRIWRIILNGKNPFEDSELFPACPTRKESFARLDVEKGQDSLFLGKAKRSLTNWGRDVDQQLIFKVFDASIRTDEMDRDLNRVVDLLGFSSQKVSQSTQAKPSDEAYEEIMKHDDLIPVSSLAEIFANYVAQEGINKIQFSFAGLDFTGVRAPLWTKVLESMNIALTSDDIYQKTEAAIALTMTNLASDDFGLPLDIDRGLQSLIIAAELGSVAYQALVLRFHEAFDRPIPISVASKIVGWLSEAAATGSMTALEDMQEHGYHDDAKKSLRLLQTRYCGVGVEMFEDDDEADEILQCTNETDISGYIEKELKIGKAAGQDISGYLLRIASAYGNVFAIDILVNKFSADVNDMNAMKEGPLLFAARSGHLGALLRLLEFDADPKTRSYTEDTPLHWLCAFPDETSHQAGLALVSAGADIDAQAGEYPDEEGFLYAELDYFAGTPLHRAIARNNLSAVKALLDLGADPHAPAGDNIDMTPFALSVLLHYPKLVKILLSKAKNDFSRWILLPSGKSILEFAMSGGTLYGSTMGRLIRHGRHQVSRAEETLSVLLQAGVSSHIHDLPEMYGCTAVFYASQCHVSVLNFLLRNGGLADIDKPSARPSVNRDEDGDDETKHPPLFEAVVWGKLQNVSVLLQAGANVNAVMSQDNQVSILYCCADHGLEHMPTIQLILELGVDVDKTPPDYQTPFACAVANRCFKLAGFLREKGADPNTLYRKGLFNHTAYPSTLLGFLVIKNSQSSISCLDFLLQKKPHLMPVHLVVEPVLNYTVFHRLALIPGDSQDSVTTTLALSACSSYFDPGPDDLNQTTLRAPNSDGSVESEGGNTALHLAVIFANFEVVKWLLLSVEGVDTSIRNASSFTAIDLAALSYPKFWQRFVPRDVPRHPNKQMNDARLRRKEIWKLLKRHSSQGVTEGLREKFTVDEDEDEEDLTMGNGWWSDENEAFVT